MSYRVERSEEEINKLWNDVVEAENEGRTKSRGTYEQGILYLLEWLFDEDARHPLED